MRNTIIVKITLLPLIIKCMTHLSFVLIINEKFVNNIISNNQMYDTFVICINN